MLTVLSNNRDLWILLLALVIDIAISEFDALSFVLLLLTSLLLLLIIDLNKISTIGGCFYSLFPGLGFLAGIFRFTTIISNDYLVNHSALYSN